MHIHTVDYHAKLVAPFAVLGIVISSDQHGDALVGLHYLAPGTPALKPQNPLAAEVCRQLRAWLKNPDFVFDLPLRLDGTAHQQKVWRAIQEIPRGHTRSYAEIAAALSSAPRAVGQACGANPVPLIVPCHRVIAKNGGLGGFMGGRNALPLAIKEWLLRYENAFDNEHERA